MIEISPFSRKFDRANFECGEPSLDGYLRTQISQDIKKKVASCFFLHEPGSVEILGYYTLSTVSAELGDIPEGIRKKLPRYPDIPMALLGRLAVSKEAQGRGYGEVLLIDACRRILKTSETIGIWAVAVEPLNESARKFYERFQFEDLGKNRMFLTLKEVAENLG